ncbi:uncharacterized protein LOC117406250 isoform X2 [Acipenser ruthenus]|uniref:uncharacterized protein LOC117406250 isoform X2 n=1 Tax=Acipenser ruthenus TaxID=7906 RepID=UPI00274296BB|nr:uncharacterized protein LOC117406250 isoform X2 [Acipenser ruthenus]
MLRRGQAMLPFFLLTWVLRLTQALASAHDPLQDEAAANSMSGTGNLDLGGNLSLPTDLAIPYAEDLFSKQDYFSPNGKGELSKIAGYSADQQRQSLDHVFSEPDAANDGLFDFSQHYRYDENALEQPVFFNPDSDDFNSDLTKTSVPFVAEYPMASESEGDVKHVLFTDRSNDPDVDFPQVFAYAHSATSDKENVSNTATLDLLAVNDSVINLAAEVGIGELGKEFDSSDHKSGDYSETLGYDSPAFAELEKEGTDTLHPDVRSYHREDLVTGDLNGMHVSSFDRSVLTDINLQLDEALSPALKIASALNSPDLSGGPRVPSSIYDASVGLYGVFNLPITPENPPPHSTGEPTTLASATTCGVAGMTIKLFGGRLTDLKVRAAFMLVEVSKVTQRCKYKVFEKNGVVHFTTAFKGCHVKAWGGQYVLTLMWRNNYVHMSCPIPTPDRPITICGKSSMTIKLPAGPIEALRVKNKFNKWVSIHEVAVKCKYQLLSDSEGRITFTTSYNGCHVRRLMDRYFYNIYYQVAPGKLGQALMSCRTGINVTVPPEASLPSVFCGKSGMIITLPKGSLNEVKVRDGFGKAIPVGSIAKQCNYQLFQMKTGHVILIASFQSCQIAFVNGNYVLAIIYTTYSGDFASVQIECPTTGEPTKPPPSTKPIPPTPVCRASSMMVKLPEGPLEQVKIMNNSNGLWVAVKDVPKNCNYTLMKERGSNLFITSYKACHVRILNKNYVLTIIYTTATGVRGMVQMTCPAVETTTHTTRTTTIGKPGTTGKPTKPTLPPTPVCKASSMTVALPSGSLQVLLLNMSNEWVDVNAAPSYCNYSLVQGRGGRNFFTAPYRACDVRIQNGNYMLTLLYITAADERGYLDIRCPTTGGDPTETTRTSGGELTGTTGGEMTTTWKPTMPPLPDTALCRASSMTVELPSELLQILVLSPSNEWVDISDAPSYCNYSLVQGRGGKNFFTTPYRACDVRIQDGSYILTLLYITTAKGGYVHMRCPITTSGGTSRTTSGEPPSRTTSGEPPSRTTIGEPTRTTSRKTTSGKTITRTTTGWEPTETTSPSGGELAGTTGGEMTTIWEPTMPTLPDTALCRASSMTVELPSELLQILVLSPSNEWVDISDAPSYCNYSLVQGRGGKNFFTTPYRACDVRIQDGSYILTLLYITTAKGGYMHMRCPIPISGKTTRTTSGKTSRTTIGEPTRTASGRTTIGVQTSRTTSGRTSRTTSGRTSRTTIGELTRTTSRRTTSGKTSRTTIGEPTRTTSRRTSRTTIGEPTRTTSRRTTSGRTSRTTSRKTTRTTSRRTTSGRTSRTTIGEPTRTTSRRTTSGRTSRTTIGELTRTTSRRTTSGRTSRTTIGEPTRTTSRRTTSGRTSRTTSRKTTRTTSRRTTSGRTSRTTIGEPTRTTSRRTTSGRTSRTTIGEPTRTTSRRTTSGRTSRTTIGELTRTTSRRTTSGRTTSRKTTRTTSGRTSRTTIGEPTRTTSRRTTSGRTSRTTIGELTRTTSRRTTSGRTTSRKTTRTTSGRTSRTTIGEPTRTTSRRTISGRTSRTTIGEPTSRTTSGKTTKAPTNVVCTASNMVVELPREPLTLVKVLDKSNKWVAVIDAPKYCNYTLSQGRGRNFFITPYTACDVRILNNNYVLKIWYLTTGGKKGYVVMKCPTGAGEPTKSPTTTTWERTKPTRTTGIATKTTMSSTSREPTVVCTASSMVVELSKEPLVLVELLAESSKWVAVIDAPENCNYTLIQSRERNLFKTPYTACDVKILNENYFLALRYTTIDGKVGYVQMKCPTSAGEPTKAPATTHTTRKSTRTPPAPDVVCNSSGMMVELPKVPLDLVELLDYSNKWVVVNKAPVYCNYTLLQGSGRTLFITPYKACDVRILNENYILTLRYTTSGQQVYVHMKCPTSAAAPTKTLSSTTTIGKPTIPTVCKASVMTMELPEGPIEQVALIDKSNTLVTVKDDTRECGYSLVHGRGKNIFTTPYTACDVKMLNGNYVLTLAYVTLTGRRVPVQMKCPTSAALPTGSPLPPFGVSVLCSDTCMTVELPEGLLQDIQLMDESNNLVAVTSAPKTCGYSLVKGNGKNILTAPYNACNVKILNNFYILRVLYTTLTGERGAIQAKCPVPGLVPHEGCKIPRSQQVACGPPNADLQLCVANGCCVDATTSQCYYPLEACTADGHFVFSVYRTSTKPEIDPGSLVIAGNQSCAPVICTPDFAIFKFPVTGCGTHVFTVAETTIYLAEVHGLVRGNQQVYGKITRDGPYRFHVECRYSKGSLASTGYLMVNPPPPSAALAFGSLGVRLRIATDTSYTSFYPQSHVPLSFLVGSKVYLEVQLVNPPNPNVVLLVHYCIAYPQSSQAAWVILYEGCPNILDYSSAAGLHVKYNNMPVSKHTRRFEIQSFQFLDYKTKQHLDEEIYFMCSTEVCSPERRVCNEGCFDGRDMPVPVDLGVGGRCAGKPCPGKSNVVKRAASGHTGLIAVGEGTFILDENVPHEQTEKHWTHFHGLLGLLGLLVSVSVVMLFLKKWVVLKIVRSQRSSL